MREEMNFKIAALVSPRERGILAAMSDTNTYSQHFQNAGTALNYATRFDRPSRRRINAREQKAVRKAFAPLKDCRSVLDVPCGAGRFLGVLAQENREVIEMDVAAEMVDLARERAGAVAKARFMQGDAARIPLPDQSVDCVFCNRLLHHIVSAAERAVFLREFHRVTRRYLVISFFDYRSFGTLRIFLKKLKGRKVNYGAKPTLQEFRVEFAACGFREVSFIPTGLPWVSQKYFVLERA